MTKTNRIYIRMDDDELKILDQKCAALGLNRSDLIRLMITKTNTLLLSTKIDK